MADQKRKGRPPGASNVEYATLEHVPETCPKCKSTELKKVQGAKVKKRELVGTLPSGFRYRAVHWVRKQCVCGQFVMVRTYFPQN